MAVRNATDIVILCENVLGWVPDENLPLWQARATHAGRVTKAMAKHDVTLDQLELAIEYCRRRREGVKSPAGLVFKVARALELANEPVVTTDLETSVSEAIAWEREHEDHLTLGWVSRLTRAIGGYRADVLAEWRESGRG